MAIESLGGYSSVGSIPTVHSERKVMSDEKNAAEGNTMATEGAKVVTSLQTDVKNQENEENQVKENPENHLKSVLSVANQKIRMTNTRCEFEYHDTTKRVSIKVIAKETDEVVREIPPEETLEMVEKIWELAGLIVDERR